MNKGTLLMLLAGGWVLFRLGRNFRSVRKYKPDKKQDNFIWEKGHCVCGTPREKWRAIAMEKLTRTVLLTCPTCHRLWEEKMEINGNKWRQVDEVYAQNRYAYEKK